MNEPKISPERAGAIALAVVKVIWSNRGVDLKPEKFAAELHRLEKQTGVKKLNLVYFLAKEILAPTFLKATDVKIDITVHYNHGIDTTYDAGKIALALLKTEGIDLRPDQTQERLQRLAERTKISVTELMDFMVQEIIPAAITATTGQPCRVTVEKPLPTLPCPGLPCM